MKKDTGRKIISEMLPHLPGFATNRKKMFFMAPIGHTLRALLFESSIDKNGFYFVWFFMPICRPTDHLELSYGDRLPSPVRTGWRLDLPDLPMLLVKEANKNAVPFLRKLDSIPKTVSAIKARKKGRLDMHDLEEIGYLLILEGDFSAAARELSELNKQDCTRQWERDVVARGLSVLDLLRQDPRIACDQIKAWQAKTLDDLKLDAWK
jgi:hypothetical protein